MFQDRLSAQCPYNLQRIACPQASVLWAQTELLELAKKLNIVNTARSQFKIALIGTMRGPFALHPALNMHQSGGAGRCEFLPETDALTQLGKLAGELLTAGNGAAAQKRLALPFLPPPA